MVKHNFEIRFALFGARLNRRGSIILLVAMLFVATIFGAVVALKIDGRVQARNPVSLEGREKATYRYVVQSGDTLDKIALEHLSPEYQDYRVLTDEIVKLNHCSYDNIRSGQVLYIPYYYDSSRWYEEPSAE